MQLISVSYNVSFMGISLSAAQPLHSFSCAPFRHCSVLISFYLLDCFLPRKVSNQQIMYSREQKNRFRQRMSLQCSYFILFIRLFSAAKSFKSANYVFQRAKKQVPAKNFFSAGTCFFILQCSYFILFIRLFSAAKSFKSANYVFQRAKKQVPAKNFFSAGTCFFIFKITAL